jgi:hypothetical protein
VAIFVAVMTPLLAYLAPLGFAPLAGPGGPAGLAGPEADARRRAALLILVALALWAAVSMSWSPAAVDVSKLKDYGDIESVTALKLFLQLATYGAAVVALRGLSDAGARRAATVLAYGMVAWPHRRAGLADRRGDLPETAHGDRRGDPAGPGDGQGLAVDLRLGAAVLAGGADPVAAVASRPDLAAGRG